MELYILILLGIYTIISGGIAIVFIQVDGLSMCKTFSDYVWFSLPFAICIAGLVGTAVQQTLMRGF